MKTDPRLVLEVSVTESPFFKRSLSRTARNWLCLRGHKNLQNNLLFSATKSVTPPNQIMKTKQLTLGLVPLFLLAPLSLIRAADVVSVWGGARGTIILKSDGTVWTWGANFNGKLGIGETNDVRALTPVEVHGPGNVG